MVKATEFLITRFEHHCIEIYDFKLRSNIFQCYEFNGYFLFYFFCVYNSDIVYCVIDGTWSHHPVNRAEQSREYSRRKSRILAHHVYVIPPCRRTQFEHHQEKTFCVG